MQIKFLWIYLRPEVPFHRSSNLILGAIFNCLEYLDEMREASFKNIRHIWYRSPVPNDHHLREKLIFLGVGGYFLQKQTKKKNTHEIDGDWVHMMNLTTDLNSD